MFIGPSAPFKISHDPDGTKHAIKDNIKFSILPDIGECEISHKYAEQPFSKSFSNATRWLHIALGDVHLYVHGTHVLVTKRKDIVITFKEDRSPSDILELCMRNMKAHKDEKGRYVVDSERNRDILIQAFDMLSRNERLDAVAKLRYVENKITE